MKKKFIFIMVLVISMFVMQGCQEAPCQQCNDEQIMACPFCEGKQKIRCSNCGGDMFESCMACDGTGSNFEKCETCDGDGEIMNPITWQKFRCEVCRGEGAAFFSCQKCNGYGNSNRECTVCDFGEVHCFECAGVGHVPCSFCKVDEYNAIIEENRKKNADYEDALQKLENHEYEEAKELFLKLGNYKDCIAKLHEIEANLEQISYNSQFELQGDWKSVNEVETYFFSEEYGIEDKNLRITKETENSYKIVYIYDDGSTSTSVWHTIYIKGNEFDFSTFESQLKDDDIKVYFLENGNLIFEKYHQGEEEPWSSYEVQKID